MNLERRGSGSPVVLVHGVGSRLQVWAPVVDALSARHEVIAVDLPGFGASPLEAGVEPSVRGYARYLASAFADLGIAAPHVVGNSMGGGIALELGRAGVAARVTAFSPVGFWTPVERRWCQGVLRAAAAVCGRIRPALPRVLGTRAGRVAVTGLLVGHPTRLDPATTVADVHGVIDAPGLRPALTSFAGYDVRDPAQDWGALPDVPVTIAWGSRDHLLIHRTQSRRARAALPFAHHVTLRSAGHVPFNDDPAACAEVVLAPPSVRA